MTIRLDAVPVATPIDASGHFFHHALIAPTFFLASLHPCGVRGFLEVEEHGNTAHPYSVAYLIAASSNLLLIALYYPFYGRPRLRWVAEQERNAVAL